jgi:hypothetical protein
LPGAPSRKPVSRGRGGCRAWGQPHPRSGSGPDPPAGPRSIRS